MVDIEIDGKKINVEEGTSIIEAADALNIYIPRFCYHKKLSIAANCRMCLVEVEKVGKPLPACATPVTPGMRVMTASKKAVEAQRAVMEFLLINHPLDCPICDQGGECELQDLAMGFGRSYSVYDESKRAVFSENIGPLVETEMTRCIQCTRCVRFGEEVAGLRELGVINRGENEAIATAIQQVVRSELSGNIIDLCPVGALTDKPARYRGRGWEYREHPLISPHDGVGSNLFVHSRGHEYLPQRHVLRAVPRENEDINETWISDRDRYSHFGLYDETRVYQPMLKKNGIWQEVTWEVALHETAHYVQSLLNETDEIAALASPHSTVEELYVMQKFIRGLGSPHIDHRLRWQDFTDQADMPLFPGTEIPIKDIEKRDLILLIGSNVRLEQPIIAHRINQAYLAGAKILSINPMDYHFHFEVHHKTILDPLRMPHFLAEIARALEEHSGEIKGPLQSIQPSEEAFAIAKLIQFAEKPAIFLGAHALQHSRASEIRSFAQAIAQSSGGSLNILTEGANSSGAWLCGAIPHRGPAGEAIERVGFDAQTLLTKSKKLYFLFNFEPEYDCAYAADAINTLKQSNHVICMTPFVSEAMKEYADIILPLAPFTETGGTYINVEGRWQSFLPASIPHGESQPGWKILCRLARLLHLPGFAYKTTQEIHHELKKRVDETFSGTVFYPLKPVSSYETQLTRVAPWPIVRTDNLVRRSLPLQETLTADIHYIKINEKTARKLGLQSQSQVTAMQGSSSVTLPLAIDARLADNAVLLPSALAETAGFGQAEAAITLEEAK